MKINFVKNIGFLVMTLLLGAVLVFGCSSKKSTNPGNGGGNPAPTGNLVVISGNNFNPQQLIVSFGTTVTWRNDDNVNHTVTSDSGNLMQSPLMGNGQTYQKTFTEVGTFPYHCTVHSGMTGTIIVQ